MGNKYEVQNSIHFMWRQGQYWKIWMIFLYIENLIPLTPLKKIPVDKT